MNEFWDGLGTATIIIAIGILLFFVGITVRSCSPENRNKPFVETLR